MGFKRRAGGYLWGFGLPVPSGWGKSLVHCRADGRTGPWWGRHVRYRACGLRGHQAGRCVGSRTGCSAVRCVVRVSGPGVNHLDVPCSVHGAGRCADCLHGGWCSSRCGCWLSSRSGRCTGRCVECGVGTRFAFRRCWRMYGPTHSTSVRLSRCPDLTRLGRTDTDLPRWVFLLEQPTTALVLRMAEDHSESGRVLLH